MFLLLSYVFLRFEIIIIIIIIIVVVVVVVVIVIIIIIIFIRWQTNTEIGLWQAHDV